MSFNDFQPNSRGSVNNRASGQRGSISPMTPTSSAGNNTGTVFSSKLLSGGSAGSDSGAPNSIEALARQLQDFQQNITMFSKRLGEYKKKKGGVSAAEKRDCEAQLAEYRSQESRISAGYAAQREQLTKSSSMFSSTAAALSGSGGSSSSSSGGKGGTSASNSASAHTAELATRRLALSKIGNDINRITSVLQQCGNDISMLNVTSYSSNGSGSGGSSSSSGGRGGSDQQQQQMLQQQQQFQALKGQDVDDMILEERERDITQINKDVQLVNEMFKDMANIVQSQQPMVEEIHKTTEDAAAHAKEGLDQVKQAAEYQPTCVVM